MKTNQSFNSYYLEMNYINKDKNYMTDEERIRYLEESIRELRIEKDRIRKEKGEIRKRNLELEEENKKIKADYIKLSKIVETTGGYKASYVNELRDKIAKLEIYKKQYKHTMGEDYIDEDLYDLDC